MVQQNPFLENLAVLALRRQTAAEPSQKQIQKKMEELLPIINFSREVAIKANLPSDDISIQKMHHMLLPELPRTAVRFLEEKAQELRPNLDIKKVIKWKRKLSFGEVVALLEPENEFISTAKQAREAVSEEFYLLGSLNEAAGGQGFEKEPVRVHIRNQGSFLAFVSRDFCYEGGDGITAIAPVINGILSPVLKKTKYVKYLE